MERDPLTNIVIGCAIEVHKHLGPGLLESTYQHCLCKEFELQNLSFRSECPLPVVYKGLALECGYRVDILVENQLILELKSVKEIHEIHKAQILTYMKLSGISTGLLLNFNVTLLKNGIYRFKL
jgi:GxxExxY protein